MDKISSAVLILVVSFVSWCHVETAYQEKEALPPTFLSKPSKIYAKKGDLVALNCTVDKIGESVVILWQKNGELLAIGSQLMMADLNNVKVEKLNNGYLLKLEDIGEEDIGNYTCVINHPNMKPLLHVVDILVSVDIEKTPFNGLVHEMIGTNVSLQCQASGNPKPKVTWTKGGRKFTEGVSHPDGYVLNLPSIGPENGGSYECTASNGMSKDVVKSFKVSVRFQPEIELKEKWIHTGVGRSVSINCSIHASNPIQQLEWVRKSGAKVKTAVRHIDRVGTKHFIGLLLPRVTDDDFGEYTCFAKNDVGSAFKKVHVSGKAERVNFKSKPLGNSESSYMLSWTVKSYSPILDYTLKLRETKYESSQFIIQKIPSKATLMTAGVYEEKFEISDLKAGTQYDVIMQTRNNYGLSEFSDTFTFRTKSFGEPIFRENENNLKDPESLNEIQVGVKPSGNVNSAHSLSAVVVPFILTISSILCFIS